MYHGTLWRALTLNNSTSLTGPLCHPVCGECRWPVNILLSNMKQLRHAVETSHEAFIVCHTASQLQVSEVNVAGHVIRVYCDQQQLGSPEYLALDSDGRVLVADMNKHVAVEQSPGTGASSARHRTSSTCSASMATVLRRTNSSTDRR